MNGQRWIYSSAACRKSESEEITAMPIRRLKLFFAESDTRTLELFLSVACLLWSIWLSYDGKEAVHSFYAAITKGGGATLWVTAGIFTFLWQAIAACYCDMRSRGWAAAWASFYWIMLAYITGRAGFGTFYPHFAAYLATGNLWIVLHKVATTPAAEAAKRDNCRNL